MEREGVWECRECGSASSLLEIDVV
jgi:ribosomal protein L37AE/L43A